jgi:amino acid adenylation domain-containing protein
MNKNIAREIMFSEEEFKEQLEYWLTVIDEELHPTRLAVEVQQSKDTPRAIEQVSITLPAALARQLVRFSKNADLTLYVLLLTGFKVLLSRYSRSSEILVVSPLLELDRAPGPYETFNKRVLFRDRVNTQMTFKELLLKTKDTTLKSFKNQDYPLDLVFKEKGLNIEAFPFLDNFIFLLNNIHDEENINDLHYDILVSLSREGEDIHGVIKYNYHVYKKETVEDLGKRYIRILDQGINHADMPVKDLELLTPEEKDRLLVTFNGISSEYPRDKAIQVLFEEQVEANPDHIAVVKDDNSITYSQLNEKANQLAHFLRSKGVPSQQDNIVGLMVEPSLAMIVGILGILKAGAAYSPIDPAWPEKRILSILEDCGISLVITGVKLFDRFVFTAFRNIKTGIVEPVRTPPRPQITDFDSLPLPDRTLVDYRKHHRFIGEAMARHTVTMQATRGCPYQCAYCHKLWPKKHVTRSAENIFQEIRYCYNAGIRRFVFIDDIFNLDRRNTTRLLETIIKHSLDLQLFFPNGLRTDILCKDYIDLMIEAGTIDIGVALESGSPRIQKLIRKNLDLEKFYENVNYIVKTYPQVVVEMELMLGFPTETEEEAMETLNFLERLKWIHFPDLHILKIYPNTDMGRLAVEKGVSPEAIERSTNLAYHQLPETLPFSKGFAREIQSRLLSEYLMAKERVLEVLPHQVKVFTEDELVQKYDSYFPVEIKRFTDITRFLGVTMEELGNPVLLPGNWKAVPDFNQQVKTYFPGKKPDIDAFKVLLLDLSQYFSHVEEEMLHFQSEEPLGLMYLLTYLNKEFGPGIHGQIFKSGVDFDSFRELRELVTGFQPDLVGIRTLSYYREFFHQALSLLKQWGITAPIISGGPYASSDHRFILQDPNLDIVVFGEGEITLTELVQQMITHGKKLPPDDVLAKIQGISFVATGDKTLLKQQNREVLLLERIWDELPRFPGHNPGKVNRPTDLLYLISTSGSTGKPKSVMLEHQNLNNLLYHQFNHTNVDYSGRVLQFASIGFDVSAQEIFSTLLSGGQLVISASEIKNDVFRLLDLIEKNRIDILFFPPSYLKFIFSEPNYARRFPRTIRHIITAGEQLIITGPLKKYLSENRVYIHNHYGPSETHVVTMLTIDPGSAIPERPSIGKPISNTKIFILDAHQNLLPVGVVGELVIGGANVGPGYYHREALTAERFVPCLPDKTQKMYRTGDLARWLPDGNIEFLGRVDYQVKVRGYRVELEEIETHLAAVNEINEAVVIDTTDHNGDSYLSAYIVTNGDLDIPRLRETLKQRIPGYMIPSYFIPLERIPLTSNGKVDRKQLPAPTAAASGEYIAPRDEIEKNLVGIWREVLGGDALNAPIGINDNFFELGGHSLKATIMISKIHKELDVMVPMMELFKRPTIQELSGFIKGMETDKYISIEPAKENKYYPLSSAQKRIYISQQLRVNNVGFNMSSVVVLAGLLDKDKLENLFLQLITRHESLRTSFEVPEDEPVQRVHEKVNFKIEYNHLEGKVEVDEIIRQFIRPFDLSGPPLLRVGLIRTGETEHILMLDIHHIVIDGTSIGIFYQDLMALYEGKPLPRLRLQYKDYACWQNSNAAGLLLKKQEAYWLRQFNGNIPAPGIPMDYPRPDLKSFAGERISYEIDTARTTALKKLTLDTRCTLQMVLLAIHTVLLFKYSGQEDIVVGTGTAGRRHADLGSIIGIFINMLALRNYPQRNKTFREFLAEVKENSLMAYKNQDYPFDELVKTLGLQGDGSANPLFDTVLQMQNFDIPGINVPGLTLKPYPYESKNVRFDLVLNIVEDQGILRMMLDYCTALFKNSTARDFLKHFMEIADQVLENREIKLKDIKISTKFTALQSTVQEDKTQFGF